MIVYFFYLIKNVIIQKSAWKEEWIKNECYNNYTFYSHLSILFSATTNGVFLFFSILIDSIVWGSNPCIISTTNIAISHKDDPRLRRLLKDSCPGVSMISKPGSFRSISPAWNVKIDNVYIISEYVTGITILSKREVRCLRNIFGKYNKLYKNKKECLQLCFKNEIFGKR